MLGRESKITQVKFTAVQYVIVAVFMVLAYGLWSLQVRRSGELVVKADQNRIKRVPILAPRGKILDRDGNIIVDNYPSFSALLLRDQMRDLNADARKIADGLHLPAEDVLDKIHRAQAARLPVFQPIIIKDDITQDERAFIEAHRDEFPELETLMVYRRRYQYGTFMAHLIGYVGEVSEDMLNSPQFEVYQRGDIVGQSGVEQQYNDVLMGQDGSRRVLVNSKGKEVGRPKDSPNVPPVPGRKLKLTIDLDLQKAAEEALEGKNGAIVAMNPRNGEILAMVSRPTFDPNVFAVRISRDEWNRLTEDPDHPLLNKAIQAQVAPGSVFKILMSVAGLQEGVAQTLKVNCQGGGIFYGQFHQCWIRDRHQVHGIVDINKAIPQSCDVFFYTLAERLGIEKIAQWGTALGIGRKTGIDLPNEVSGIMPSEEWKFKTFRQKWYPGEVISVGIGQGALAVSPIQMARAIGAIAMGGTLHRPHVVNPDDLPSEFRKNMESDGREAEHVRIDPQNWITITDAMAAVLNPGGTGAASHIQGVDFAGKTGSTQIVSHAFLAAHGPNAKQLYKGNGWFAGVTPRRNPEIVVVVFFEAGEHGDKTAPIAAQVIKAYVEKQRRVRSNPLLFSDKADPGSVPMASLWSVPADDEDNPGHAPAEVAEANREEHFRGGTFVLKMPATRKMARPPAIGASVLSGGN
jgi:penicillin-binding protein 2